MDGNGTARMELLSQAVHDVSFAPSMEAGLAVLARAGAELLGADRALAMVLLEDHTVQVASWGSLEAGPLSRLSPEALAALTALLASCPVTPLAGLAQAVPGLEPALAKAGLGRGTALGLRGRQGLVGLILVEGVEPCEWGEGLKGVLNPWSTILACALESRRLALELEDRSRQVQRAQQQLVSLEQIKTNLLAMLSHELRAPLVSIKGYTELILGEELGPITAAQRRGLEVADRNISLLEGMIEDVLLFARADDDRPEAFEAIDLACLIQKALALVEPRRRQHQIAVELKDERPASGTILGAPKELLRLLFNLLDNAIKFNGKGGLVEVRLIQEEEMAKVSVADSGEGIPSDQVDRIFDIFHQVDSLPTRRHRGAGVGLAVVLRVARRHGGTVEVSSVPGQGSTFVVTLPRTPLRPRG